MTTRTAQALLTGILLVPLMIVALSGPPWAKVSQAQSPAGGMLGPLAPARVDTSGDGQPSGNDTGIVPTRNGNQITLMTPWNCNPGDSDNVVNMSNLSGSGQFQTFTRSADGFRSQAVTTGGLVNGRPMSLNFTEMSQLSPATTASGVLAGQDSNGDGAVDGINAAGSHNGIGMNVSTSLAFADPK